MPLALVSLGKALIGGLSRRYETVTWLRKGHEKEGIMKSKSILAAVERGRWSRRGNEKAHQFEKSMFMLATNELKLAARWSENQRQVWAAVGRLQALLKKRVQAEVQDQRSRCSLQLTLEQPTVQSLLRGYVGAFENLPHGRKHAIGFAVSVNGEFAGAELFDSRQCPSAAPKPNPHAMPCPASSPRRPGTGHHPTPCPPPPSPNSPSGGTPSSPDTGRRSVVPK